MGDFLFLFLAREKELGNSLNFIFEVSQSIEAPFFPLFIFFMTFFQSKAHQSALSHKVNYPLNVLLLRG